MTTAEPSVILRGLSRGQLLAFDALLALAVAVLGWLAARETPLPPRPIWHEPGWLSVATGVLLAVPLVVRRLWPEPTAWAALAVVTAAMGSGVIPEYAGVVPLAVLALVLYTVGTDVAVPRSVRLVLVSLALAGVAFGWAARQPFEVFLILWAIGACWTVGLAVRERRAYVVRSAAQATELALGQERLRIARDLHDIVAHNMSVIAVRATVADHIADDQPREMRESLRVIAATSRDALVELRRALGTLRAEAVVAPTPGLADLGSLVESARSANLVVDLEVRGDPEVPEGVGVAVFRMVQEALTNVIKHARAATCRVDIDIGPGVLRLQVTDDGSAGPKGNGQGQGLIGMRERAALFGGDLAAGPSPTGGWAVATTLRYAL
ncbi:sensor histidine kinase [Actinoplanes sp. KI2]|uniref:sensor histidine kinase n=1 Tax=Actinoplanes sp. KI2 TaxID=2983315 RepID=UPI0021D5DE34|nr:sensor histidine kinase [Actinoplanes sp. KI2]MCU7730036.1 sensor histidine kinase [Actinoplanes sp. KI2]